MRFIRLLVLICLICFSACTRLVATFAGVKINYSGITKTKLNRYFERHFEEYNKNYYLFDQSLVDSFKYIPFKPNWTGGVGYIQFQMYDNEGRLISQYSSCEGPRNKFDILSSYPPRNLNPIDNKYMLYEESRYIWNNDLEPILIKKDSTVDATIIVYWATFTGKFGIKLVKDIYRYIHSYPDKKFRVYLVSLDKIID